MTVGHYAVFVGLRYSFSRKRNRFTALIALISMLGMVLGVASLITVLSVMNGFGGELRNRILSLVPHGFVQPATGSQVDWEAARQRLTALDGILAASPYITDKAIVSKGVIVRGIVLTAIEPALEASVSGVPKAMTQGSIDSIEGREFNIVLGAALARILGADIGDKVELTLPRLTVTPLGVFPKTKRLTVSGIFEIGAQADAFQAYVSLPVGQRLLGKVGQVDGLQVKTTSLFEAPGILARVARELSGDYLVRDWSQTQGSLFAAVKMEKLMVSILLLSVVAVAAFNIVSTLVMSVAEKRRDIAVLRTLGARAGEIMAIFVAHGLALATVGIAVGALLGIGLATYISESTVWVESALGVKIFDPAVYFISELPAQLQWADVVAVIGASLVLSLLATVYPAWRAAKVAPAEVLRYE